MKEKINICMVSNGHVFAINLGILITSILVNSNKEDEFYFHIITDNMSNEDKNKLIQLKEIKNFDIKFYTPDINRIAKYKKWAKTFCVQEFWGYSIYFKLEVIHLLTHLDKVIFLDVDQMVLKSLSEIYYTNLDSYYIIAADHQFDIRLYRNETYKLLNIKSIEEYDNNRIKNEKSIYQHYKNLQIDYKKTHIPFCSGFMCMNLKLLRNEMKEEFINDYVETCINNNVKVYEQDILIYFIKKDKIKFVDPKYNIPMAIWLKEESCDVYIAHFSCGKIFEISHDAVPAPKEKNRLLLQGWKYLSMTAWFKEDPIYFMDRFNQYDRTCLERKIDKVINFILWIIPIKAIRDNIRKFFLDY
ncbi:glycosyltransferase family 8 protein [Brachyspira alvinipulli]|uniref:glycosyltransferase family 8 protein n=1 Tax=Brachyspira alvinipulli TaxID=84379 RepID=UPI0004ADC668|nr:glycosyltransferase [Brachyspira alvinipulli]